MEKAYLAILAIGEDAPGIVEAITGVLSEEYSCNVETSQMTIVGGHFATTLIASSEVEPDSAQIEVSLRAAGGGSRVRGVYVRQLDSKSFRPFGGPEASHSITAWADDRPGILHAIARALAEKNVNITTLSSGCSEEKDSLCVMTFDVSLPVGMQEADLKKIFAGLPDVGVENVSVEIEPVHQNA
jgi:glycine cleavage system regulatory protein